MKTVDTRHAAEIKRLKSLQETSNKLKQEKCLQQVSADIAAFNDLDKFLRAIREVGFHLKDRHEVSEQLHQHFEGLVYRTVIPRNVRLAEAPSHGVPGIVYDRLSRGSTAYMALAGEFMRRQEQNKERG